MRVPLLSKLHNMTVATTIAHKTPVWTCRPELVSSECHFCCDTDAEGVPGGRQGTSLEAIIAVLQGELGEVKEKARRLEDENAALRQSVAHYRANWINECQELDAWHLSHARGESDIPSLSQAGWLSSSPIRTYGW